MNGLWIGLFQYWCLQTEPPHENKIKNADGDPELIIPSDISDIPQKCQQNPLLHS